MLLPFVWLLFESRKKPEAVAPRMRSSRDVAPSDGQTIETPPGT
jgi:hypothetical protein